MTHTPGSWRVTYRHDVTSDTGIVSRAPAQNARNAAMNGANAHLIAASPDLLAALEQIVMDWDRVTTSQQVPDEINVDDHWQAARDAIAKAKGCES